MNLLSLCKSTSLSLTLSPKSSGAAKRRNARSPCTFMKIINKIEFLHSIPITACCANYCTSINQAHPLNLLKSTLYSSKEAESETERQQRCGGMGCALHVQCRYSQLQIRSAYQWAFNFATSSIHFTPQEEEEEDGREFMRNCIKQGLYITSRYTYIYD